MFVHESCGGTWDGAIGSLLLDTGTWARAILLIFDDVVN